MFSDGRCMVGGDRHTVSLFSHLFFSSKSKNQKCLDGCNMHGAAVKISMVTM